MADVLNPQVVDTLTVEEAKTVAGAPANALAALYQVMSHSVGQTIQNATSEQNAFTALRMAVTTLATNKLLNIDIEEAIASLKTTSGNDLAQQIAQLLNAASSNQQAAKVAQTTPPVTA